jgi:hypothetical protein
MSASNFNKLSAMDLYMDREQRMKGNFIGNLINDGMKNIRIQQLGFLRSPKNSGNGIAFIWVAESESGYNRILSLSIQSPYL